MKLSMNLMEITKISEESLELRRRFVRLGQEDQKNIQELLPWAEQYAPIIAKEFYDWQFSYTPTLNFLKEMGMKKGVPMEALRRQLEDSQAGYYLGIFKGASSNWGTNYFAYRMKIGLIHDVIDLPLKFYVGSYTEYQLLTEKYLKKKFKSAAQVAKYMMSINKVFNYDLQAITDSFFVSTLISMGLSFDGIDVETGKDRTEKIKDMKVRVKTLLDQSKAIASGNLVDPVLDQRVPGELGESMSAMSHNLIQLIRSISENTMMVANSSTELNSLSDSLSKNAEENTRMSMSAASSAEQVSQSINSVATAAEEMTATAREIASNVSSASKVAYEAKVVAEETNKTVKMLDDSSNQIGKIIKVISDIAGQTNLLALNATIEAARAGDAGKGFAVVANEVKELAKQTANATEEIRTQIEGIQNNASAVIDAIGKIGTIINDINDKQTSVASAIEEQTVTSNEITKSVTEAAGATSVISDTIKKVAESSEINKVNSSETLTTSHALSQMAEKLRQLIRQFNVNQDHHDKAHEQTSRDRVKPMKVA